MGGRAWLQGRGRAGRSAPCACAWARDLLPALRDVQEPSHRALVTAEILVPSVQVGSRPLLLRGGWGEQYSVI